MSRDHPRRPSHLATTALAVLAVLTGVAACAVGSGEWAAGDPTPDTVRGTVAIVGADPATRVVLRTDASRITVEGPAEATLRTVAGLGVRVDGRRQGPTIHAVAFRVREAAGIPAADGTLEVRGDTAVLVTPGQRLRYVPVPAALAAREGARVWIAGEVGREPQAWGVIEP